MSKSRKQAEDDFGRTKTARQWIENFLSGNKHMRLKEIKEKLDKVGITYADNKGLTLVLNRMIGEGVVRKKMANPYPLYYLTENAMTDQEWIADEFKRDVCGKLSRGYPHLPFIENESDEEYKVRKLIQLYGSYMMYVQIQSWKIIDPEKSRVENYDMRRAWFRYTILHGKESGIFDEMITDLAGLKFHKNTDEYTEKLACIYESDKKKEALKKTEKIFKRHYSDYFDLFDEAFQKAPKSAEESRKWVKEIIQRKARIKNKSGKK